MGWNENTLGQLFTLSTCNKYVIIKLIYHKKIYCNIVKRHFYKKSLGGDLHSPIVRLTYLIRHIHSGIKAPFSWT